jgi:predicted  nucleic acid-binding Zn-ribbon protein
VKQALKNQSSQPTLEQRRVTAKQSVKYLHAQIHNNKELLAKLQPALELKKTRKATFEAELRNLTAEVKADEKKIAKLPKSMEKI